jgi:hypothetical protein
MMSHLQVNLHWQRKSNIGCTCYGSLSNTIATRLRIKIGM